MSRGTPVSPSPLTSRPSLIFSFSRWHQSEKQGNQLYTYDARRAMRGNERHIAILIFSEKRDKREREEEGDQIATDNRTRSEQLLILFLLFVVAYFVLSSAASTVKSSHRRAAVA